MTVRSSVESDHLPNGEVMEKIAEECHIDVANVCAVVAPTSSMVGSIQVAGRCVETAIYKLNELGFDTRKINAAMGSHRSHRYADQRWQWVSPMMQRFTMGGSP